MDWTTPIKPAELTESRLIEAILQGDFPIGSCLPAERELATRLGVTRPTLREAMQRLARDGWLEIHQGKSTRVRDFWHEGNLGVLGAIALHSERLPQDFVPNLLFVRQLLAPRYARLAVELNPLGVIEVLEGYALLPDFPDDFAAFDWNLHHQLTIFSGNPIFTLILNGFCDLYLPMACQYFGLSAARASSRLFYAGLLAAAQSQDATTAEAITLSVMKASLSFWYQSAGAAGQVNK
jgi:GntR family transcriptional regulator, negative regulator for fad regulon and positive regulator of fabA